MDVVVLVCPTDQEHGYLAVPGFHCGFWADMVPEARLAPGSGSAPILPPQFSRPRLRMLCGTVSNITY